MLLIGLCLEIQLQQWPLQRPFGILGETESTPNYTTSFRVHRHANQKASECLEVNYAFEYA